MTSEGCEMKRTLLLPTTTLIVLPAGKMDGSRLLDRSASSSQLVLVGVLSATAAALAVLSVQAATSTLRRSPPLTAEEERARKVQQELDQYVAQAAGPTAVKRKMSEVIIREALARNYVFFPDGGMDKIRESFVIVVGLGGVGSAAATMLVRSGVGKIRLIDFDQVSLSSLNVSACPTDIAAH